MTDPLTVTFEGQTYDAVSLLIALHANTRALGLGLMHEQPGKMTRDEACERINEAAANPLPGRHWFRFDYVRGRPIKVKAEQTGELDPLSRKLYDRDAGQGAFDDALREAAAAQEIR